MSYCVAHTVHLRGDLLRERSLPQKNTDQMTPRIRHVRKGSMPPWWRTKQWLPGGRREVTWGRFGGDGTTLVTVVAAQIYTYVKIHGTDNQARPFASTLILKIKFRKFQEKIKTGFKLYRQDRCPRKTIPPHLIYPRMSLCCLFK